MGLILGVCSYFTYAQDVVITNVWARPTVTGQKTAAVFMAIASPKAGALIKAQTKIAKAELHEMAMQGDVMKMRPVKEIAFSANQAIFLRPGGLHIMLLNLKKPLQTGDILPLNLTFKYADGSKDRVTVEAQVENKNPDASQTMMH